MKLNSSLLYKFERSIDTIDPENSQIPIKMLGYGEISLVFELLDDTEPIAYKRLPIFENENQVKRHVKAYEVYHLLLKNLGFNLPSFDSISFSSSHGRIVLYCAQEKVPSASFGHKIIHTVPKEEVHLLVHKIMCKMLKIWDFNAYNPKIDIGIDGQISNWSIIDYDVDSKISVHSELLYADTSTPLFRINGMEAMESELFLSSAPSFLRFILKALFLEDVVGRYYDFRLVTIDLLANFFKEQLPELIPGLLKLVNTFFSTEAKHLGIPPLTFKEIKEYYDEDKQIWVIFQNARRLDRWVQTKLFRKHYDFYLPGKIHR